MMSAFGLAEEVAPWGGFCATLEALSAASEHSKIGRISAHRCRVNCIGTLSDIRLIPPPPPKQASSAKFSSIPVRARWNRTTPAKCVPRRRIRHRRWQWPLVPTTAECWHLSKPAAPAPRWQTVHRPCARLAECEPRPVVRPPGGFRSPPLHNSRQTDVSAMTIAFRRPSSRLRQRGSAPGAATVPDVPSRSSTSSEYPLSYWPTQESNSPRSRRESPQY